MTVSWARSPQGKRLRSLFSYIVASFYFSSCFLSQACLVFISHPPCFYPSFKNVDQEVKTLTSLAEMYLTVRAHASLPWWRRGVESADDALSPGPTNCLPGLATDRAASWSLEGLWPSLGGCPPLNAAVQGNDTAGHGLLGKAAAPNPAHILPCWEEICHKPSLPH